MNLDQHTAAEPRRLHDAPAWPYAVVLLVYAAALLVMGSALRVHFGFPLDDSWIHQTVGRNFAWFHSLGYLPHQRSSGSTSLLWTLIVSANYTLLPHLSPIVYCLAVNSCCLLAIGLMLLRLALRDGIPPALAVLWAAAPALDGNVVWLAFTGMEHLLFIALSLASILLWYATDRRPGLPTAVAAGAAMGLLCMTRPEGIVLPLGLLLFSRAARRKLREMTVAGLITAALAILPFSVNLVTSHALLPVTFKGRQWMYFAAGGGPSVYRKQLLEQWVLRPAKAVLAVEGASLTPTGIKLIYIATAIILLLVAIALYCLVARRRTGTLLVCAWAAVHSLLYVVMLPVSGHGGRYQPFLLLLLLPLLALGTAQVLTVVLSSQRIAVALTGTALAAVGALSLPLWRNVLAAGVDHIADSHGAMAAYLNGQHVTEPIAVFDIGRIGYDRGGNLTDLGGLTDSAYVAYLYGNRVPEYLAAHHISLVVLPVDGTNSTIADELHLRNNPALTLQPLHRECTPYAIWHLGWIMTRHADQCQELDRILPARP